MSNINGAIVRDSPYTVKETIDRLQAALKKRGVTIFIRIDQQQELQKVGQIIPPLEFLLFGNPKAGGLVMALNPAAALDLPLKVVAWQDEQGGVRVVYNDAGYIRNRYDLSEGVSVPLNLEPLMAEVLS